MAFCKTHRRTEIQIHDYKKIFKVKNCCWPLHLHHKFLWCFSSPSWKGESRTLASSNKFFLQHHSNKIITFFSSYLSAANLSATYLSFAIIKLSNKISGVMDQSSRPTAAYRQTTHMKNEYVWLWHQCFTRQKDCTPTTKVPCRMREQ